MGSDDLVRSSADRRFGRTVIGLIILGFELEAAVKPLSELIEQTEKRAPGLASEDARLAVQEDLPEAIGFIRTSTQKMDRLINAILRLSREGRRTIVAERIELTPLGTAIVDGIRHQVDERGAVIEVQPDMPAIVSDPLAVEQILSNLIENALKYLQPGRPGRKAERVVITVADNGRGIDPRDHGVAKGTGLGAKLIKAMAATLKASVDYRDAAPGLRATVTAA